MTSENNHVQIDAFDFARQIIVHLVNMKGQVFLMKDEHPSPNRL